MNWFTLNKATIPLACIAAIAATNTAFAQSIFELNPRYYYSYEEWATRMTILRVLLMSVCVGSGFGLGWFYRPKPKSSANSL